MTGQAVIYDLEYTAWDGSMARGWSDPDEHREVVQIGAVRLDPETANEIDCFQCLVRPAFNPVLSDFFCTLTGIAQDAVDTEGHSFAAAYAAFLAFAGPARLYCYGWDHVVFAENIEIYKLDASFPPVTPAGNIRDWFVDQGLDLRGINSGKIAQSLGLKIEGPGQEHDALYDCRSIAAAIRHLIAEGAPSPLLTPLPSGPRRGTLAS